MGKQFDFKLKSEVTNLQISLKLLSKLAHISLIFIFIVHVCTSIGS